MGLYPVTFSELEFYLIGKEISAESTYLRYPSNTGMQLASEIRRSAALQMIDDGVAVRREHAECGSGHVEGTDLNCIQSEIELFLQEACKTCDDTLKGKYLISQIAAQRGVVADFMPKPYPNIAGSGLHFHMRLNNKDGENLMTYTDAYAKLRPEDKGQLGQFNQIGSSFIAGILKYSRDITSIFGAFSEQTYQRLGKSEAPVWTFWGQANRAAILRQPSTGPKDIRIEFRAGDFSGSPHLLTASFLAAGLDGIKQGLQCPAPYNGNIAKCTHQELEALGIKRLPTSLAEGKKILAESEFALKVLGEGLRGYLVHPVAGHE
ncbi:glutamine_synthetase [Hexamita inflata]|uniref:Glutamine_synthetase n=2 Tax=Hexamita inflata TaxID=28002 RepID=A0ABP1HI67_9EUKA